jgi:hypothetical protein
LNNQQAGLAVEMQVATDSLSSGLANHSPLSLLGEN